MSSKRGKNPALPVLDDAFRLESVKDTEESARDLAARLATTELRRASHPGRVTGGLFGVLDRLESERVVKYGQGWILAAL